MPAQLVLLRVLPCYACNGARQVFECGTDAGWWQCEACQGLGFHDIGSRDTSFPNFLENYQMEYRRWELTMQQHPKIIHHYFDNGPSKSPLSLINRGPEDYPEGLEVLPADLQSELLALAEHLFENADPRDGYRRFVYPIELLHDRIRQLVRELKLSPSWMWV